MIGRLLNPPLQLRDLLRQRLDLPALLLQQRHEVRRDLAGQPRRAGHAALLLLLRLKARGQRGGGVRAVRRRGAADGEAERRTEARRVAIARWSCGVTGTNVSVMVVEEKGASVPRGESSVGMAMQKGSITDTDSTGMSMMTVVLRNSGRRDVTSSRLCFCTPYLELHAARLAATACVRRGQTP